MSDGQVAPAAGEKRSGNKVKGNGQNCKQVVIEIKRMQKRRMNDAYIILS